MKLTDQKLITISGGACLVCSIIDRLIQFVRYLNIKHLMRHVFED